MRGRPLPRRHQAKECEPVAPRRIAIQRQTGIRTPVPGSQSAEFQPMKTPSSASRAPSLPAMKSPIWAAAEEIPGYQDEQRDHDHPKQRPQNTTPPHRGPRMRHGLTYTVVVLFRLLSPFRWRGQRAKWARAKSRVGGPCRGTVAWSRFGSVPLGFDAPVTCYRKRDLFSKGHPFLVTRKSFPPPTGAGHAKPLPLFSLLTYDLSHELHILFFHGCSPRRCATRRLARIALSAALLFGFASLANTARGGDAQCDELRRGAG